MKREYLMAPGSKENEFAEIKAANPRKDGEGEAEYVARVAVETSKLAREGIPEDAVRKAVTTMKTTIDQIAEKYGIGSEGPERSVFETISASYNENITRDAIKMCEMAEEVEFVEKFGLHLTEQRVMEIIYAAVETVRPMLEAQQELSEAAEAADAQRDAEARAGRVVH